ncbi:pyridoxal phosphate-dependent aminotransferase [Nocardioides terrisoli]|uniref:pyridoxal phosphate-dependent aminotransferase n=1 Tax=Nocardioides terrisoli TaxID=3388267 RepID=UPI00287BADEE|nr:aminotransferase class I/II-fold pyridoxal phosphate-dependent enzyme [Nocardioides marmorisolisilvae]
MQGRLEAARHVVGAPTSGIRDLFALASTIPECIHLELGQPDFRTPSHICEAAKWAIDAGDHGYTPTKGIPALLDLITEKLARVNGHDVSVDQVLIGNGGTSLLAGAVLAVCEPGDEILISNPYWPTLRTIVALAGARAVLYRCPREQDYQPDLDHLSAQISPRTKAIVINSPNNPTGAVYSGEMLARIGEIAAAAGVWVISDECYDQIMLDGTAAAPSAATFMDPDRSITAMAFSKTYAMTGWRIGYGFASSDVVTQMLKVADATNSCINTISQRAAQGALQGPQDCIDQMTASYRDRLQLSQKWLSEEGIPGNDPSGAFYLMADVSTSGLSSHEFATRMLLEHGVAVAPGSAFGSAAEGAVRISLASAATDLRKGISRMGELLRSAAAGRVQPHMVKE